MTKSHTQNTESNCEEPKSEFSLAEYSQTHPYQYLKKMNHIFSSCNKTSGKDYSTISMVKLPWKKFKTVSIPECFQNSYNLENTPSHFISQSDQTEPNEEQEKEKKFWKEHQELIRSYHQKNKGFQNLKKSRSKFSSQSLASKTAEWAKKTADSQLSFSQNENRPPSKLKKHKDQSNIFLRKIIQNGSELYYDSQKLEQEVLQKLKKIDAPKFSRQNSRNQSRNNNERGKEKLIRRQAMSKTPQVPACYESRVRCEEFLEFQEESELISRYKEKIRQIDCSISDKNVKNCSKILKEMQLMLHEEYDV